MRLRVHPAASTELGEGAEYYFARAPSAAEAFLRAYQDAANTAMRYPEIGSRGTRSPAVRRWRLRGFPYSIVYRNTGGDLQIIAVAHHSRRPGYCHDRL